MARIFLSMGSNMGNRMDFLKNASLAVKKDIGTVSAKSLVYETQSWGYEGMNYLNMVLQVNTSLSPEKLLLAIQKIEASLGRVKTIGRYTDRPIDLDILFYENEVLNVDNLVIPHPRIQDRLFVLAPMMDVDPDFVHPVLNKTIMMLREECSDQSWIKTIGKME